MLLNKGLRDDVNVCCVVKDKGSLSLALIVRLNFALQGNRRLYLYATYERVLFNAFNYSSSNIRGFLLRLLSFLRLACS